ncbi:MAG TPA: hypothetical protein VFG62_22280 [Rhodopila sp.]|nr:hypothetical protein [Rhodopila sp.]
MNADDRVEAEKPLRKFRISSFWTGHGNEKGLRTDGAYPEILYSVSLNFLCHMKPGGYAACRSASSKLEFERGGRRLNGPIRVHLRHLRSNKLALNPHAL